MSASSFKPTTHVVDVLGNVIGRDQPIMKMDKALEMISYLGEEIFHNEEIVFFDPFCKAGELLLACAFMSCKAKSTKKILDLEVVKKEIYESNRYFGMAPDERHHKLSLRTFLGNEESHNKKYNHIIQDGHYVSETDGRLDQDKFEKEFKSMIDYIKTKSGNKKIVAVGNPPYQEDDGGFGKSAKSIYNYFTERLIESGDVSEFILVIPARWFAGGKGLDSFRENIMKSGKVKNLVGFSNSSHVFPTVDINGGICYLHYDKAHKGETLFTDGKNEEKLNLNEFDIITDDPKGFPLARKLLKQWDGKYVSSVAWPRKPFGLATNHSEWVKQGHKNALPCVAKNKEINYVDKSIIRKNTDKIDLWKVSAPKAAGGSKGNRRSTIPKNQIFMIPKGTISIETYNVIDTFKSKSEAENFIEYLQTDFARYFLGLRKITQDLPADRWSWVPYVDCSRKWTDEDLFKLFKFNKEEQEHIKKKVKEWS